MPRIEIAALDDAPQAIGRPLMSDHNLSARLWATAALLSIPFAPVIGLGWWFPVHLALLGAASQAIVGGQLMFSATLGLARGPSRTTTLYQLALLNAGAALVVGGRVWANEIALGSGATLFLGGITWAAVLVDRQWRASPNRRFAVTGTFYRLAATSVLFGATIGAALGLGWFDDASSYMAHRSVHMAFNVLGWAGLSIVGTAITLLPTIMHVRAAPLAPVRATPWLMFGGLIVVSTGATIDTGWVTAAGFASLVAGLATFALYVKRIVTIPRRRRVPAAALHLMAALGWMAIVTVLAVFFSAVEDHAALRDILVVGGAAGTIFQALLGAWSFLLPSTRPPIPERRRRELVAMELGGRSQVAVYNAGIVLVLVGLLSGAPVSLIGIWLAWGAAAWGLIKTWVFPLLATLPSVEVASARWWAPPEEEATPQRPE